MFQQQQGASTKNWVHKNHVLQTSFDTMQRHWFGEGGAEYTCYYCNMFYTENWTHRNYMLQHKVVLHFLEVNAYP